MDIFQLVKLGDFQISLLLFFYRYYRDYAELKRLRMDLEDDHMRYSPFILPVMHTHSNWLGKLRAWCDFFSRHAMFLVGKNR